MQKDTVAPARAQKTIAVRAELYEQLQALAEQEHRTIAGTVEHAVRAWLGARDAVR